LQKPGFPRLRHSPSTKGKPLFSLRSPLQSLVQNTRNFKNFIFIIEKQYLNFNKNKNGSIIKSNSGFYFGQVIKTESGTNQKYLWLFLRKKFLTLVTREGKLKLWT